LDKATVNILHGSIRFPGLFTAVRADPDESKPLFPKMGNYDTDRSAGFILVDDNLHDLVPGPGGKEIVAKSTIFQHFRQFG